ncbi:hypothetical protein F183_A14440 [Bryobacterales bacterium F-183]|nr:hypothetical protein F183_A14440 [Bryobacterales bacterium F-183]
MRTGAKFEAVLARLYTDEEYRMRFLQDPGAIAVEAGLSLEEAAALAVIDREGLDLACRSFQFKRDAKV